MIIKTRPPRCKACGGPDPHAVKRQVTGAFVWLCASCEYREQYPGAEPHIDRLRQVMPLQSERLF